jgi:hypothetical protein
MFLPFLKGNKQRFARGHRRSVCARTGRLNSSSQADSHGEDKRKVCPGLELS